jgi:hypothetical protein
MMFFVSCGDSDGSDPATTGTLNITVNVSNPEAWPSEGTVFLSLETNWPPQGPPYKSAVVTSSDAVNGVISTVFEDLAFGTYKLLAISWQDPNNPDPTTNQYIWGTHSGNRFAPTGQFIFYADATEFTFTQDMDTLSLVIDATVNTGS